MSVEKKFLLRKSTGDQPIAESELRDWFQKGQCKPADFLYDYSTQAWTRVGDHALLASFFAEKPSQAPDRRVIYFLSPGGSASMPQGPFSTKEIQQRAQLREICSTTWVFVEGDKEWRQVRSVKILNDMLPALPADQPVAPTAAAPQAPPAFSLAEASPSSPTSELSSSTNPSISIDLGAGSGTPPPFSPPSASDEPHIEREEEHTLAVDVMGLNLHSDNLDVAPPPAPMRPAKPGIASMPTAAAPPTVPPSAPPAAPPKAAPPAPPASANLSLAMETPPGGTQKPKKVGDSDFDGIVAEIPMDPVWLVKTGTSETVSGPFRFLEVVKFLEEGKLTRNDKIYRQGTKSFVKIQQQYEFNVKFSLETVVENGQEKQKILIRRRHPRVPYMTGVQIVSKYGLLAGQCVNISAGGILMEVPKAEFNLGEIIEVKILPGLIAKSISCKSLIIGKIPKAPPGYALKFEDLKPDDKEAIEYYVQETLKREMSKKS